MVMTVTTTTTTMTSTDKEEGEQEEKDTDEHAGSMPQPQAENFRLLCHGNGPSQAAWNRDRCYRNAPFHRVVPNFVVQGGDFTRAPASSLSCSLCSQTEKPHSEKVAGLAWPSEVVDCH